MGNNYSFAIDEFATELKQHLNLSIPAWRTIKEDIQNFYPSEREESFSGFLNRVFYHFYPHADASISLRLQQQRAGFANMCSKETLKDLDEKTLDFCMRKSMDDYKEWLKQRAFSYPSGHGEKFRINRQNLEILRESEEAAYYEGSIGQYLKAVFEEYALQPAGARERIFFMDTVDKIEKALSHQRKLKIVLSEKVDVKGVYHYSTKYYVSPYKIVQDRTGQFNYLVGYCERIKEDKEVGEDGKERKTTVVQDKTIGCFRISRIHQAAVMASMGAKLSEEKKKALDYELERRTPMYMSSEVIDIKVLFSEKGLEMFRRTLFMRPHHYDVDPKDRHIYTIHCSKSQLRNYLFKFGWDAIVLEPKPIAERFLRGYERAVRTYHGEKREDILAEEKAVKEANAERPLNEPANG